MEHNEKINYMRIAAGICCMGFTNKQLDLLVSLYELIMKKEGKASINDAVKIEHEVKERAEAIEVKYREEFERDVDVILKHEEAANGPYNDEQRAAERLRIIKRLNG